jgi:hypothetical protein
MGWALLGALLIGISLGLLGSGGSILTVPVLVFLLDEPEKVAIAESLGVVAAISLFGAIPYAIRKEVDWKSVVFFGVPGTLGTYAGAGFSEFLSGNTQFMIFGVVMILAAFMMLRNGPGFKKANPETGKAKWLLVIEGLIVGVITGLVGVGGGFLIIPALVLVAGLDMRIAVGTSLFIIAAKSSLGFYKYLDVLRNSDMQVNWQLLIVFTLIGILGSLVGGRLSRKIPQRALRRGFGVFLVLMGVYILGANFF